MTHIYTKILGALAISSSLLLALSACASDTGTQLTSEVKSIPGVKIIIGSEFAKKISVDNLSRNNHDGINFINFKVHNRTKTPLLIYYSTYWQTKKEMALGHGFAPVSEINGASTQEITMLPPDPQGYQVHIRVKVQSIDRNSLQLTQDDYMGMTSNVLSQLMQDKIQSHKWNRNTQIFLGDVINLTNETGIPVDVIQQSAQHYLQEYLKFIPDITATCLKLNMEITKTTTPDGKTARYVFKLILKNVALMLEDAKVSQQIYTSVLTLHKK